MNGILPWQKRFLDDFDNHPTHRFYMKKLHRRSRKTTMATTLLVREAMTHPNKVYVYCSPTYTQSKAIVWNTPEMLFSILPPEHLGYWKAHPQELYIEFKNNARLVLKGSDNFESLKGLDATGIVLDEWSLQKYEVWDEVFRPIMTAKSDTKRWSMFIYTPKANTFTIRMENHAKDPENVRWDYEKLSADTSGIMDEDELEAARKEAHTKSIFEQEYLCSDLSDDERILITPYLVNELTKYKPIYHTYRRIVACDPSTGGDECVIYYMVNGKVEDEEIIRERNTMIIAGYVMQMCNKHKCKNAIIDNNGVGQGVYDRLREMGIDARTFMSQESANDKNRFINKRAEAWYLLMEKMERHEIPPIEDRILINQFNTVGFHIVDSNGKIKIDSKKDIKKRLGGSCDRADAFVYGTYGLQYVEEEGEDGRTINRNYKKKKSSNWAL